MKITLPIVATALFALSNPVVAAGVADQISVVDPLVRLMPPGAKTTGAFMILRNAGDGDAQLVKADSAAARIAELHNHINDAGVMRMRQVKEITIPARGETALQPGGYHIMLIDLKTALKEGDHVVIHLDFADGSRKEVHATVRRPTASLQPMKEPDHSRMHKH
jgi:periplasmic copper chaperone A